MTNTPKTDLLKLDVANLDKLTRTELTEIGKGLSVKAPHLGGVTTIINKIKIAYYEALIARTNDNTVNDGTAPAIETGLTQEKTADQPDVFAVSPREGEMTVESGIYIPEQPTNQEIAERYILGLKAMRRVQIHCLNPMKSTMRGEIFTVHDRTVGTLRKHIPFGTKYYVNGYHIEQAFYTHLKEREYQNLIERTIHWGGAEQKVPAGEMMPEFSIVDLPPLTIPELQELALKQEQAKRIDKD
ncbi:MAG: hypothetical protein K0U41_06650 [Gammaproteobacteria bacterium]|nr:hypothetical protein [Gammaproteobacteria bacterium]